MCALPRLTSLAVVVLMSIACGLSEARESTSGSADNPVEIDGEPLHSIRLVNSVIRVYEAQIPVGSRTLFHAHRHGGAGIDMTATRLSIEKVGETSNEEISTKAGDIFPLNLSMPFVHRVVNLGTEAYRVVVAELLQAPDVSARASTVAGTRNYKLELETDRVLAYRLTLHPGEATTTHTLRAQTLIVSVSGGQLSVSAPGQANRLVSLAPGALEWNSDPFTITIRNLGVSDYESVYFEWKPATR